MPPDNTTPDNKQSQESNEILRLQKFVGKVPVSSGTGTSIEKLADGLTEDELKSTSLLDALKKKLGR